MDRERYVLCHIYRLSLLNLSGESAIFLAPFSTVVVGCLGSYNRH